MQSYTWARGLIVCIIAGSFLSGSLQQAFAASGSEYFPQPPELPAFKHFEAALLQDAQTGQVLFAHKSQKIWPQASLTKMMLGLIVFEDIERGRVNLETQVTISRRASHTKGRTISLRPGQVFRLAELLRAVLVTSANDAAVAIAEHVCGSVSQCVQRMNARARQLGMEQTRYRTVNGMPTKTDRAPDKASADDIALLTRALLRHHHVLAWTAQPSMPFGHRRKHLPNTNRLVGRTHGVDGLKTGFTRKAGFNLVTTAQRGSLRLIAIVFGGKTSRMRFRVAEDLLEWGFDNFTRLPLIEGGSLLWVEVRVENGNLSAFQPVAAATAAPLVPKGDVGAVSISLQLPTHVAAPVLRNQVLGEVVVRRGKKTLATIPAVSPNDIPQARWAHVRR
jgi:D-alanyl-D-alanine carboxypeptidase (penicillin-binding protein 5/6)